MNMRARWWVGVALILALPWVAGAQETPKSPAEPSKPPAAKDVKTAPPAGESKPDAAKDKSEPKTPLLGLNSASEKELKGLPGLTEDDVKRIVKDRPYKNKEDLIDRKVLPSKTYEKIKALVVADPVTTPMAK
jgi:competence protein ComEA